MALCSSVDLSSSSLSMTLSPLVLSAKSFHLRMPTVSEGCPYSPFLSHFFLSAVLCDRLHSHL